MSSNDARARRRRRFALALFGLAPALACAAPKTHCRADEKVYFSCVAGKKTVSLCGREASGSIAALTYRYGMLDKVENEFTATSASGPHFMATVEPDSPGAEISEIWFDRGTTRYLMTSCLGGDCPYRGGLAVLRGEHILSSSKCQRDPDSVDAFSSDLVEFGDGTEHSKSHTPLLEIGDYSHPVDKLYPLPDRVSR
jgi:hypothetical protein